jgi:hypothetical protein
MIRPKLVTHPEIPLPLSMVGRPSHAETRFNRKTTIVSPSFKKDERGTSRRSAIVLLEACVAIMLIGLLLTVVSLLLTRYARATDYLLNQRRAQLAAESCVERIRAGVLSLADADFVTEGEVRCSVRVADATREWSPLLRVSVKTEVTGKHGRQAKHELAAYVEKPPATEEE